MMIDTYEYNNNNLYDYNHQYTEPEDHDRGPHFYRQHHHRHPARKRPFPHLPAECSDDGVGFVKLYVAGIPITSTQDEIHSIFEVYGNILDIAILKDQRTGEQRECCFIKYSTLEESDSAIGALNNQYTFPGAKLPIKVRYAEGERRRLGKMGDHVVKLYVNNLQKQASKWDIREIFSAYGHVVDIHIVLDEFKQSRGWGFIQFARRDMAFAAKEALNGTFYMAGCDQPLFVRFADPKKPRVGDPRHFPFIFFIFFLQDCTSRMKSVEYLAIVVIIVVLIYLVLSSVHQPALSLKFLHVHRISDLNFCKGKKRDGFLITRGRRLSLYFLFPSASTTHLRFPSIFSIFRNNSKFGDFTVSSQIQEPAIRSVSLLNDSMAANMRPNVSHQFSPKTTASSSQSPRIGGKTDTSCSTPTASEEEEYLDCDWSEHTCPDGFKYYFNCVSCESRWEKPWEYSMFEQQFQKQYEYQQKHQNSGPSSPRVEQISQIQT